MLRRTSTERGSGLSAKTLFRRFYLPRRGIPPVVVALCGRNPVLSVAWESAEGCGEKCKAPWESGKGCCEKGNSPRERRKGPRESLKGPSHHPKASWGDAGVSASLRELCHHFSESRYRWSSRAMIARGWESLEAQSVTKQLLHDFLRSGWMSYALRNKRARDGNPVMEQSLLSMDKKLELLTRELADRHEFADALRDKHEIRELNAFNPGTWALEAEIASQEKEKERQLLTWLEVPFTREFVERITSRLSYEHKITYVQPIDTVEEAFSHVATEVNDELERGFAGSATVYFAGVQIAKFKLTPLLARFVPKVFRPRELAWVPTLPSDAQAVEPDRSRYAAEHCALVITQPAMTLIVPTPLDFGGGLVVAMSELVKDQVAKANGVLDLSTPYVDAPFLEAVRQRVLAGTLDASRWKAAAWVAGGTQPSSIDAHALFKDDWALLAAAPWAGNVRREWAILKHTVENGERPRFWSERFADSYGFRMRTRDHTWLIGRVFVDTTQPCASSGTAIEWLPENPINRDERSFFSNQQVARLGRMYVQVREAHGETDW